MTSSSRPAPVVCRHPAWAGVARWAASALLVGVGTLAHAVPPAHGSVSTLVRLFGHVKAEAGYLAVVGVPPLRWLERPAAPRAEQPLITLFATELPAPASGATAAHPAGDPANASAGAEPKKPAAVRPEDFLPFFERGAGDPATPAVPDDGQRFVPAHSTLPPSRADYHLK